MSIKNLTPEVYPGSINLQALEMLVANLGITDEKPQPNEHLDYSKMTGGCIRILNKINHDMNEQKALDFYQFLNITDKDKVMDPLQLRDIFRQKGIINYGEDLDDDFSGK